MSKKKTLIDAMPVGSKWVGHTSFRDKALGERIVHQHRSSFVEFKTSTGTISRLNYPGRNDQITIENDKVIILCDMDDNPITLTYERIAA